jgi:hypothetical protein
MTFIRRTLPALITAAFALPLVACDVGAVSPLGGGPGSPDASIGPGTDGAIAPACIAKATPTTGTHLADGHHVGEGCMASAGCHGAGSGRDFGAAGTIYLADGTTPAGGATVVIGTSTIITGANGNFYIAVPPTFPTTTRVTSCPSNMKMVGQLQAAGGGDCNTCHKAGGVTTPMHL